ncbi:YadA-like family protein [Photobacterium kishitanii]|uniref:YadA-like family protein n=1 Tax=Photobacterium kishitanii TaxID=318456 RepID=UPI001F1A926B|nr:YadA-like family protein [Photobacterium kishitanii]
MNSYKKTCAVIAILSTSTMTYASPINTHSQSNNLSNNITHGYQAKTKIEKDSAIAIGVAASSIGNQSIALGTNAYAHDDSAVSFGAGSSATGIQSTATGSRANANGDAASALGSGATATGRRSIAIGSESKTTGDHAMAIGNYASADKTTISLGGHAIATGRNSIAIGNNSHSNDGQVSFGNAKTQRRLEYVANGRANTDAVNMSQLNQQIAQTRTYTQQQKQTAITQTKTYVTQQSTATLNKAKMYTDHQSATTLSAANQYTDQKVNLLTHNIEKVHNQANAGIASAMAMTSIPMRQGYHYTIGMGAANYGNQSAMAIGGKFDVGQHGVITLAASDDSQHDAGIAAGFGFGF